MAVRISVDDSETLVAFVDTFVPSFETWDVLTYLAAHADRPVGLDDLTRSIGRRPSDLVDAARELAERGALEPGPDGVWFLSKDEEVRQGLCLFAEAIRDPRRRQQLFIHLLQNLSR
jgi:hypothetical protein